MTALNIAALHTPVLPYHNQSKEISDFTNEGFLLGGTSSPP